LDVEAILLLETHDRFSELLHLGRCDARLPTLQRRHAHVLEPDVVLTQHQRIGYLVLLLRGLNGVVARNALKGDRVRVDPYAGHVALAPGNKPGWRALQHDDDIVKAGLRRRLPAVINGAENDDFRSGETGGHRDGARRNIGLDSLPRSGVRGHGLRRLRTLSLFCRAFSLWL